MLKASLDLRNSHSYPNIFGVIVHKPVLNAHSMEGVLTWKHVELTIEDGLEAKITHLARVDGDVLMLLLSMLLSQVFSVVRMVFKLFLEMLDLVMVIIEAITQMFFHILDFLTWWK